MTKKYLNFPTVSILLMVLTVLIILICKYYITNTAVTKTYYAMGTNLTITIAENNFNHNVFEKAYNEFKYIESIFKNNKDLNLKNNHVINLVNIGNDLSNKTNGTFSIFLDDVIKLWQFDRTNKTISNPPTQSQINKALKSKKINLYSLAKGYGIDSVAKALKDNNINNFIINAGGDLYIAGKNFNKLWKIGINNSNKYIQCNLNEYSLATSSNLYNYYTFNGKKYGHLLNGVTGMPIQANKSITVLAKSATIADGLATAVFVNESLINNNLEYKYSVFKQNSNVLKTFNLNKECKILS